jgi:membrane-bound ClpP family serine protease
MSVSIIIALIVLGILLLLVEFLIIPGVTVAGITGTLLIIGGVFCGYYFHGTPQGHYIMLSTLGLILLVFVIALKTKTWNKVGLKTSINSHVETHGKEDFKVGDTGMTISRLTPIGKIMVNDKIVEARSMGGVIDPNVEIVIIRTEKNKLFVEPK